MDTPKLSLSVIIPVFNEEANLAGAVSTTLGALESLELDAELIIIDDHSSDDTPNIAQRLAAQNEIVRYVRHDRNQGIGAGLRSGIAAAKMEFVMLVPVDSPLSAEEIETFLARMPISDVVVGMRVERVGYTRVMLFLSFVYNRIMVPLMFNIGISDVNWIQAYRRDHFTSGLLEIRYSGIFSLVELLTRAKRNQLVITEVPLQMRKRFYGKPTSARPSVIWRTLCDMFGFFYLLHKDGSRK